MKNTQFSAAIIGLGRLACILTLGAGCGEPAASSDPVERAQTESDAKNAMQTQSNKRSEGSGPQQNTRNAMEAGARQQKAGKPK